MIECMGVLMGIDLNAFAGKDAADAASATSPPWAPSSNSTTSSKPEPASSSRVQEDVPMAEEEDDDPEAAEEKKAKAEAEELKKTGGDAYRKRDFPAAIAAYEKAWEVWPKDITYLTNLSGKSSFHYHSKDLALNRTPQLYTLNKGTTINVSRHAKRPSKKADR